MHSSFYGKEGNAIQKYVTFTLKTINKNSLFNYFNKLYFAHK